HRPFLHKGEPPRRRNDHPLRDRRHSGLFRRPERTGESRSEAGSEPGADRRATRQSPGKPLADPQGRKSAGPLRGFVRVALSFYAGFNPGGPQPSSPGALDEGVAFGARAASAPDGGYLVVRGPEARRVERA